MLELFLGQIPEAIYFALFMIFAKNLKEKRILFTILMVIEYLILLKIFVYNIWFHVILFIMTFIILKVLYKEKAQITDVFTFGIAGIILITISFISYIIIWKTIAIYLYSVILNRILLILFLIIFNKKLYNIQKLYKKLWNRNDNTKKKMKTTTFRALNVVIFNFLFYIINLGMILTIFLNGGA